MTAQSIDRIAQLGDVATLNRRLSDIVRVQRIVVQNRRAKTPRSDVLPKMAKALGVSVEDLLIVETEKTASRKGD